MVAETTDIETTEASEPTPEEIVAAPTLRRCIGSQKFGIAEHLAPIADFPLQKSQPGGIGRMCRTDWNKYTTALRVDLAERVANGTYVKGDRKAAAAKPAARAKAAPKAPVKAKAAPRAKAAPKAKAKLTRAPKAVKAAPRARTPKPKADVDSGTSFGSSSPAPKPGRKNRASSYSRPGGIEIPASTEPATEAVAEE